MNSEPVNRLNLRVSCVTVRVTQLFCAFLLALVRVWCDVGKATDLLQIGDAENGKAPTTRTRSCSVDKVLD